MTIKQIASAVLNHIYDGLKGAVANIAVSVEQLEDEVIAERNTITKEYLLKGLIDLQDLYLSINCVEVNCGSMAKCCDTDLAKFGKKALHFEIPPVLILSGIPTIKFIGSIDRTVSYKIYTDNSYKYHEYRKRKSERPYVYVDTTINANGMLDCYLFNVPLVKTVSVVALFSNPIKVLEYDCCSGDEEIYTDCGIISNEIVHRLTQKYMM